MVPMDARVAVSNVFASMGVLLLVLAGLSPSDWYPAVPLFFGVACLGVSHVLTPREDQITRWWRNRLELFWRKKT